MIKFLNYIVFFSILSAINVGHKMIRDVQIGDPIEFEISINIQPKDINSVSLMYRENENYYYKSMPMYTNIDGYYYCTLPSQFFNSSKIEYYFIIQLNNQGVVSFPDIDPEINPLNLNIYKKRTKYSYNIVVISI